MYATEREYVARLTQIDLDVAALFEEQRKLEHDYHQYVLGAETGAKVRDCRTGVCTPLYNPPAPCAPPNPCSALPVQEVVQPTTCTSGVCGIPRATAQPVAEPIVQYVEEPVYQSSTYPIHAYQAPPPIVPNPPVYETAYYPTSPNTMVPFQYRVPSVSTSYVPTYIDAPDIRPTQSLPVVNIQTFAPQRSPMPL